MQCLVVSYVIVQCMLHIDRHVCVPQSIVEAVTCFKAVRGIVSGCVRTCPGSDKYLNYRLMYQL